MNYNNSDQHIKEPPIISKHFHLPRVLMILFIVIVASIIFGAISYLWGSAQQAINGQTLQSDYPTILNTSPSPKPVANRNLKFEACDKQNRYSFLLEDTAYTLTFACPKNWIITKQFTNSKQATFSNPGGNVDFTVQFPIPSTSDLNTQISYIKLTQLQNDTIINESNITIDGQIFHTIKYELPTQNGYVPETLGLATIKNGYFYMFSYNAWTYNYDQYLPEADIFINSIVIK